MPTFILIHGALHGGWCWDEVVPGLAAAGHEALAPNLPGMGGDPTPLKDVTLKVWGDFLADLISRQAEPPVVVGHSLGGLVIGEAAERVPDKLRGLIYLAALLLPGGMSSNAFRSGRNLSVQDDILMEPDGLSFRYRPESAVASFFNTTPAAKAALAASQLTAQPVQPIGTPVTVTKARFGRVPKAYIECLQDVVLPIAAQRRLQTHWACDPVVSMDNDHSPFLCQPHALVGHILKIAAGFEAAARAEA